MLTVAIAIDIVGWLLWWMLTSMLASKKADNWVTVDYYISTALLGLSTVCSALAMLLEQPALLTGIAVPLTLIGLTALAVRALRSQNAGRQHSRLTRSR